MRRTYAMLLGLMALAPLYVIYAAWVAVDTSKPRPITAPWESNAEIECLALNLYHEARGEGEVGMRAVAAVTFNRYLDPAFPSTICGVIKQPARRGCQFSWWCDGKVDAPRDQKCWSQVLALARQIAREVRHQTFRDPTVGARYYHAQSTTWHESDQWWRGLAWTATIGGHTFYK